MWLIKYVADVFVVYIEQTNNEILPNQLLMNFYNFYCFIILLGQVTYAFNLRIAWWVCACNVMYSSRCSSIATDSIIVVILIKGCFQIAITAL